VSLHEQQPDRGHEQQRDELQHGGDDLRHGEVADAGEVDDRGQPQADHRDQDRQGFGVTGIGEDLDVPDQRDDDGGVAGPRRDPVRPGVEETSEVAERFPGVDVGAA